MGTSSTGGTTGTTGPVTQKVAVSMTIENLDFAKLTDTHKTEIKKGCQKAIAPEAGVAESAVEVTLSAGSVKVDAKITTTSDLAATIKTSVATKALAAEVVAEVKTVEGISEASTGELTVTTPTATVETVTETQTAADDTQTASRVTQVSPFPGMSLLIGCMLLYALP